MQDLSITTFSQEDKHPSSHFPSQFPAPPITIVDELQSQPKDIEPTFLFRSLSKYVMFLLDSPNS